MNKRIVSFFILNFFLISLTSCQVGPKRCGTKGCRCDKLALADYTSCQLAIVNVEKK